MSKCTLFRSNSFSKKSFPLTHQTNPITFYYRSLSENESIIVSPPPKLKDITNWIRNPDVYAKNQLGIETRRDTKPIFITNKGEASYESTAPMNNETRQLKQISSSTLNSVAPQVSVAAQNHKPVSDLLKYDTSSRELKPVGTSLATDNPNIHEVTGKAQPLQAVSTIPPKHKAHQSIRDIAYSLNRYFCRGAGAGYLSNYARYSNGRTFEPPRCGILLE